jgi:glycosyltransferase 2 family protein
LHPRMLACSSVSAGRETRRVKAWAYRLAGIFVSVFFVYLAVREVDLSESVRALGTAQPALLAAATLVYLSGLPVRTLRWRLTLRGQKALSWREIAVPLVVGHMANNVLPARTGEIYRAHFLGRRVRMSRSGVAGSIVVERMFDGLMLVFVILLVFLLFPQQHFLGTAALITAAVFLGLAVGVVFYGLAADRTNRGIARGLGLLPGALRRFVGVRLADFLRGIRGFSTTGGSLRIAGYTAVIWTIEAAAIALVVAAFGIGLPPSGYLLVFALAALSTTLPAGPGYIGPYQYAFVLALGAFAVSGETALAVSVAAQVALLGSVTVIGLALLWRETLRSGKRPLEGDPRPQQKAG